MREELNKQEISVESEVDVSVITDTWASEMIVLEPHCRVRKASTLTNETCDFLPAIV